MTTIDAAGAQLPEGRFVGRQAFVSGVRCAIQAAAREGWSQLLLSDVDFLDWPLGERAVIDAFNAWAGRGRHLRLLARDYGPLRLQHPRFVQWRATWSHIVDARVWTSAAAGELPTAIWSAQWTQEVLDTERCSGVSSRERARSVALHERLEAAWQRGVPGFPASVLGL